MRTTVLLTLGATLFMALPAHAELRGVALYERGDYVRARKALTDELNSPGLSKEDRVKAQLYLAAALFASGAEDSARLQLEELAKTAPTLQVDPILFPPDFVALAEKARQNVEVQRAEAEHQRQEAERQRQEAERKAREEAEAQNKPPPPPEPQEEAEPRAMQLRPELFGFVDPVGKGVGVGGGLTLGLGSMDLNARVLAGKKPGVGAEVGLLLGSGAVQPRLAVRATAVPGLSAVGGGAVAGLRMAPSSNLIFLLDVGAEYLKLGSEYESAYRAFVLTSSAGVGFNLL